jgi:signal transduction histidine kinase
MSMRESLRVRLSALFMLTVMLAFVVYLPAVALQTSQNGRDSALELQQQLGRVVAGEITAFITETAEDVEETINLRDFQGSTLAEKEALLGALLMRENAYGGIVLFDDRGNALVTLHRADGFSTHDHNDDEAVYRVPLREGTVYYSDVSFEDSGEPVITVGVPVTDLRSGIVEEVIVADLRFKPVWDLIAALDVETSNQVYVVDERGRVVAHRNPSVVLRNTTFDIPPEDGISTGLNGERVVLSRQSFPLGNRTFTIVTEVPTRVAFAQTRQSLWTTSLVGVGAGLLAGGISFVLLGPVVKPLENLAETAAGIAEGDFDRRAAAAGADEVGQLAVAFNRMAEHVQRTIRRLEYSLANEERLVRELREASRVKDEFLAVMSHELRTPLNAILGFTGVMALSTDLDEKYKKIARRITANGQRLLALIDDVLDLSRIDAGRFQLIEEAIPLRSFMTDFQARMSVLAEEKDITLRVTYAPDTPEVIMADEDALAKIVTNLVGNAIKFTAEGEVRVHISRAGEVLQLAVSDTGIGIPADIHGAIFERFRQGDSSSERRYGGAGLGLAIVAQFCEEMGGSIDVESTPGEGSTFTVSLPLRTTQLITQKE